MMSPAEREEFEQIRSALGELAAERARIDVLFTDVLAQNKLLEDRTRELMLRLCELYSKLQPDADPADWWKSQSQ